MHELSLLESLMELIVEEQIKHRFLRVNLIRLRLGALSHAAPEALEFGFQSVTHGTLAQGARLEIEMVPAFGWCPGCSQSVPVVERVGRCEQCGYLPVRLTTGSELQLSEIEVE